MVSGGKGGLHAEEDGLLGAGVDQDLVGADGGVDAGDLPAQGRISGRLGVTEPTVPKRLGGTAFKIQQLADGHGLTVRGAHQVPHGELVTGKVALQFEGRQLHEEER